MWRIKIPFGNADRTYDFYPLKEAAIPPEGKIDMALDVDADGVVHSCSGKIFDKDGRHIDTVPMKVVER